MKSAVWKYVVWRDSVAVSRNLGHKYLHVSILVSIYLNGEKPRDTIGTYRFEITGKIWHIIKNFRCLAQITHKQCFFMLFFPVWHIYSPQRFPPLSSGCCTFLNVCKMVFGSFKLKIMDSSWGQIGLTQRLLLSSSLTLVRLAMASFYITHVFNQEEAAPSRLSALALW